jgi:diguanylate cyclase (GGDEF)-like protein
VLTDDVAAAALDALPSFVAVLGPDGTVVRLNEAWRRSAATGLAVVPVRPGGSWLAACDAVGDSAAISTLARFTRQMLDHRRERARIEIPQSTPRGRRWLDVRLCQIGGGQGMLVVVDDVTDRHERESALRHHASHDPVTGLPNRPALRDRIAAALTRSAPPTPGTAVGAAPVTTSGPASAVAPGSSPPSGSGRRGGPPSTATTGPSGPIGPADGGTPKEERDTGTAPRHDAGRTAVLFLDLDEFRRINQTFGYPVGDAALRAAANRFVAVLAASETIGRWGGDEFVALAEDVSESGALDLAERLTGALSEPLLVAEHTIRLTASVGIALSGPPPVPGATDATTIPAGAATTSGPATTGPIAINPAATGSLATSPLATGPLATSPLATSPLATGPLATGPLATGAPASSRDAAAREAAARAALGAADALVERASGDVVRVRGRGRWGSGQRARPRRRPS